MTWGRRVSKYQEEELTSFMDGPLGSISALLSSRWANMDGPAKEHILWLHLRHIQLDLWRPSRTTCYFHLVWQDRKTHPEGSNIDRKPHQYTCGKDLLLFHHCRIGGSFDIDFILNLIPFFVGNQNVREQFYMCLIKSYWAIFRLYLIKLVIVFVPISKLP